MQTLRPDFSRFINALGAQLGTSLTLQNGVCALYDAQDNEAAVIELPEHSEMVVFHCRVGRCPERAADLQRLLSLNFDVARLHGCWFAVDKGDVRLCAQRELVSLDESSFCDVTRGFIVQAQEARTFLHA
ncbi:type III secretion system chaperone [Pseudomonas cannabina]|uniref:ShcE n=3 Tax=Pseudomonas syringae group TaxID=136849 RepID=I0BVW0_PSECA|nr:MULTISPECIES: type III secretion system chaperone [Pseudomonas syringae group]AFH66558.1 ShcE [Pseudomonas cannabina]KPB76994.1 ShcE [Pseudomonas syringae pv. maculicola]KPW21110.1 ShcE [Pseudomonas cannabina pv. alisalensis]MBM0138981.1 CesT family type III secretion system chaperone [Pseudomonas cannabina pv. alisalensis]QHE96282.1 CesT family type III secretion system chaperone [Pseudomonas syringae pv. maculicola str. ES4326]